MLMCSEQVDLAYLSWFAWGSLHCENLSAYEVQGLSKEEEKCHFNSLVVRWSHYFKIWEGKHASTLLLMFGKVHLGRALHL